MIRLALALLIPAFALLAAGCDTVFGSKGDPTTDEIFDAGRSDPTLLADVDYVPLFPFFTRGADGQPFDGPMDVYVGYDELIYVVDDAGLHVLDRAGRPARFLEIAGGATSVVQDRKLDVYVTARRDTTIEGQTWNLPVVLRYSGLTTGTPQLERILWHPFDDLSRRFTRPEPSEEFRDEEVAFTGVAVRADNSIYVARRGPVNETTNRSIRAQNAILVFTPEGENTRTLPLNPTRESLRSAIRPADVITYVHPPQRQSFADGRDLLIAQNPPESAPPLQFAVLSIRVVETIDGTAFQPDTPKLQVADDPTRGAGFLYEPFKFAEPADLAFAADGSNYIYVVDRGRDSLYAFTNAGVEGVAPPPGAGATTPVVVSFGGTGDGSRQFRDPNGVAYFDRVVYVADTGNGRIARYRLNTDFE